MIDKKEFFHITSVSRDDLEELGYDTSNVSDETMESIASKMADDYCDNQFWISLDAIADYFFKIPKRKD